MVKHQPDWLMRNDHPSTLFDHKEKNMVRNPVLGFLRHKATVEEQITAKVMKMQPKDYESNAADQLTSNVEQITASIATIQPAPNTPNLSLIHISEPTRPY